MIRKRKIHLALAAMALAMAGFVSVVPAADSNKADRIGPTVKIHRGEQCVEPTADMRRNHMKHLLHQRDKTMHQGIRTTKHSLKNCVDCHADPATDSVLGQDGFCSSCHEYASVKIDCFSCHTDKRDKNAVATVPAANGAKGAQP